MFLKRVKVDDFRVLKNVDLTFEPDFVPSTFPLGSLNGGGKSTLLQLIFTLLHCSFDETKHQYLVNLLSPVVDNKSDNFVLSQFDIIHESKEFSLEFLIVDNTVGREFFHFNELWDHKYDFIAHYLENTIESYNQNINFELEQPPIKKELSKLQDVMKSILHDFCNAMERNPAHSEILQLANGIINYIPKIKESDYLGELTYFMNFFEKEFPKKIRAKLDEQLNSLSEQGIIYIAHINPEKTLLCKTAESIKFLSNLAKKVFLASPSTQIFLFLSDDEKKELFYSDGTYRDSVSSVQKELVGLFTYDVAYDFVPVIIKSFKKAQEQDLAEVLVSGAYGNNIQSLMSDLNSLFFGKSITVNEKLTRVIFKLKGTGEELSPKDLSHGELKKLGIYVWLKYQEIENALVLMDEIEIGLHPDWQYEIANELQEWSHGNQFILATHSYELCQALTPSHVKELSPKLIK